MGGTEQAEPMDRAGTTQAHHCLSFGWLVAGVCRHALGQEVHECWDRSMSHLLGPLKHEMRLWGHKYSVIAQVERPPNDGVDVSELMQAISRLSLEFDMPGDDAAKKFTLRCLVGNISLTRCLPTVRVAHPPVFVAKAYAAVLVASRGYSSLAHHKHNRHSLTRPSAASRDCKWIRQVGPCSVVALCPCLASWRRCSATHRDHGQHQVNSALLALKSCKPLMAPRSGLSVRCIHRGRRGLGLSRAAY